MPNKALARTIIALILTLTVGMQVVELAMANPVPWPSTPNQDKPTLTIGSPQNNTIYNETEVYLNFTVTKPDSWNDPQWFMPYIGQIASVTAYLDGKNISNFNINVTTSGMHMLNVTVLSYAYYSGPPYNGSHIRDTNTGGSRAVYKYPLVVSDTVYFTVAGKPSPSPSLLPQEAGSFSPATMPVVVVSVTVLAVVAVAGLVVYFKKH
jgi:hypothetical protein